jgi:hypothetical protein
MKPGNTLPIALSGPQRPVADPRLARSSRPAWCSGPAGARVVPHGSAGPYPQVDSRRAAGRAGFGASGPVGAGVARRGQRGTTPWSLRPGRRRRERQRGPAGDAHAPDSLSPSRPSLPTEPALIRGPPPPAESDIFICHDSDISIALDNAKQSPAGARVVKPAASGKAVPILIRVKSPRWRHAPPAVERQDLPNDLGDLAPRGG